MIIKNTSKYPTNEVRTHVRYGLRGIPKNDKLEVHVKNFKYGSSIGAFYQRIPFISNVKAGKQHLIVIRIPAEDKFPLDHKYPKHKRCSKYKVTLQDWKEAVTSIAAHEGEHLRQYAKGKSYREDHAERRAYKTLMKYRIETQAKTNKKGRQNGAMDAHEVLTS